jgi:lipoprotein
MKLYKKAAACLLTAAMAISMLTACGGGGGTPGKPGKPGGNTPSPLPNNPDQIVLPDIDEGEGEGTGTKPTKTPIIDVNNSKLVQFSKKYAGATEFYVEMQEVGYGKDARSIDGCAARKGENCYVSMTMSGKNQKQQLIETLMLKNKSTWDQYLLLRSSKVAIKANSVKDVDMSLSTLIASKLPTQMWSTEIKVGPTKYYAEVYKYYPYEYTTCFTADGKPVYQFVRDLRDLNEKQLNSATLYKTIQAGSGTSKGLCALPIGTKTYSFDDNTGSLTDAKGNVFTLKENGTTGIKVYDQAGNDVTDDFKWLTDFFKMMS